MTHNNKDIPPRLPHLSDNLPRRSVEQAPLPEELPLGLKKHLEILVAMQLRDEMQALAGYYAGRVAFYDEKLRKLRDSASWEENSAGSGTYTEETLSDYLNARSGPSGSTRRTDEYTGSAAGRSRFFDSNVSATIDSEDFRGRPLHRTGYEPEF